MRKLLCVHGLKMKERGEERKKMKEKRYKMGRMKKKGAEMKYLEEEINKEIWKLEYFPKKDLNKIKSKVFTKLFLFLITLYGPEVAFNINGFYQVRYFEIINKKTGKVRLLKAKEQK